MRHQSQSNESCSDECEVENDIDSYVGSSDGGDVDIDEWEYSRLKKGNKLDRNKTTGWFSSDKRAKKELKKDSAKKIKKNNVSVLDYIKKLV